MKSTCPKNQTFQFNKPGAWNHWSINVKLNGHEVNEAGSVTGTITEPITESVGQPCEVTAKPTGTI